MKAVFWDMDGTLIDSEPVHSAVFEELCAEHGIAEGGVIYQNFVGVPASEILGTILHRFAPGTTIERLFAEKVMRYAGKRESLHPRPQAVEMWRRLENRGVRQGIVSNADRLICEVNLAALGLSRPGLITVSRNDVRAAKPDPEPYLRGAYLAGVEPENCLAVEDSVVGARAAVAAGMATIFWPQVDGHDAPDGCMMAADIADLDWDALLAE